MDGFLNYCQKWMRFDRKRSVWQGKMALTGMLFCGLAVPVWGQSEKVPDASSVPVTQEDSHDAMMLDSTCMDLSPSCNPFPSRPFSETFSDPFWMSAPGLDGVDRGWMGHPCGWWPLHAGFNAQFTFSATMGWGKHAPSGVGFGQHVAFAWAQSITPRLSVAAGIFAQHLDWGPWKLTDIGVGAVVAYEASDRLRLYGYLSQSVTPVHDTRPYGLFSPFSPYGLPSGRYPTRIGGMAELKIGENAFFSISVEHTH